MAEWRVKIGEWRVESGDIFDDALIGYIHMIMVQYYE